MLIERLWRSKSAPHNPSPTAAADAGADDELGEHVPTADKCEAICGSRCITDGRGTLRCPKLCRDDQDCGGDAPLCDLTRIGAAGHRFWRCVPSECSGPTPQGHSECGPNSTCSYVGRQEGGIYRCSEAGDRKAGEPCGDIDYAPVGLCAVGLKCANGLCLPTRCDSNSDCPKGTACGYMAGGATHKSCSTACANDADCPAEQRCVELPWGTRRCTKFDKPTCLQDGCSTPGAYCHVHFNSPWQLAARCERSCDPSAGSDVCGKDAFCGETDFMNALPGVKNRCYQRCGDGKPTCPDGFFCVKSAGEPFFCSFAMGTAQDRYFSSAYPEK